MLPFWDVSRVGKGMPRTGGFAGQGGPGKLKKQGINLSL